MKPLLLILAPVIAAGLLVGCGGDSRILKPEADPKLSFVYGYMDMKDAPTKLDWLTIRQFSPRIRNSMYHMRIHEGVFYFEIFPKGSFGVVRFGGSGNIVTDPHAYGIPRQDKSMRLKIKNPGIYYLGSFKYKAIKKGFLERDSFDIEKVDSPTEKEVLKRIMLFAKDSAWNAKLKKHLRSL